MTPRSWPSGSDRYDAEMPRAGGVTASRTDRRKFEIRAALVGAARDIYAERGTLDVSVQEITTLADVGLGTFYNYFASKAELLEAAITETLERHAAWLGSVLSTEPDPVVVFATSWRLTARLVVVDPTIARIIINSPAAILSADIGHAPRARRDIEAAMRSGRFVASDLDTALICTTGCLVAAMRYCDDHGAEDPDRLINGAALNLLRMFGVADDEASRVASLPLPSAELPAR
jgi:AcrR family transcriptional regulator